MSEETVTRQVVGSLTDEESKALNAHRSHIASIINEIGQLEVKKARLLGLLEEVEGHAQKTADQVFERLGIEKGHPVQVTPNGEVVSLK